MPAARRERSRHHVLPVRDAPSASTRSSCTCGTVAKRCFFVFGFLYFQLSTFTLVQWVRDHADGQLSGERVRSFVEHAEQRVAMPAVVAMTVPTPPPVPSPPPPPPPSLSTTASQQQHHTAQPRSEPQHHAPAKRAAHHAADEDADDVEETGGVDDSTVSEQLVDGMDGFESLPSVDASNGGPHTAGAAGAGGAGGSKPTRLTSWIDSDSYGKFIGITTFFNPGRHQNKVDNFRKFRASVAAQGLQMLCVELVFGDETPFQLLRPEDAEDAADTAADATGEGTAADGAPAKPLADCDILIQRRTSAGNTLWQKERLLNIALENLPRTVDKVMWLDSDLIFLNDDWVVETSELLDRFPVVQPFGWMTYLSAGEDGKDFESKLGDLPLGQGVGAVYHSAGLGVQSFPDMCFRSNFLLGHPGFAWAARRDVMRDGFYDRSIIGGGDRIMLNGFTGHYVGVSRKMPPAMADDVRAFGRRLTVLSGPTNISYTPGIVLHIWHGNRANRNYKARYEILLANSYDPVHDVRVNDAGVLEWSSQKPKLHRQVNEYFDSRKEGPKPNRSADDEAEGDDAWTAQRKSLSRPVRSFLGYHCSKSDYRASCKVAFRLWGDTLRAAQLQLLNKKLREQEAEAQARMAASREATQKRTRGKRKAMHERKMRKGKQSQHEHEQGAADG